MPTRQPAPCFSSTIRAFAEAASRPGARRGRWNSTDPLGTVGRRARSLGNTVKMKKWMVLATLSMSMFIIVIDTTIMNVSISALIEDLDTTVGGIQAAIALYALVMASFMLIGGKFVAAACGRWHKSGTRRGWYGGKRTLSH